MRNFAFDLVTSFIIWSIGFYFQFGGLGQGNSFFWNICQIILFSTIGAFSSRWAISKIHSFLNKQKV